MYPPGRFESLLREEGIKSREKSSRLVEHAQKWPQRLLVMSTASHWGKLCRSLGMATSKQHFGAESLPKITKVGPLNCHPRPMCLFCSSQEPLLVSPNASNALTISIRTEALPDGWKISQATSPPADSHCLFGIWLTCNVLPVQKSCKSRNFDRYHSR